MREQFEKLPEIASILDGLHHTIVWFGDDNKYHTSFNFDVSFINGAWYAFQEQQKQLDLINQYTAAQGESIKILNDERIKQQKKIDEALKHLKIPHYGYTAAISSISVAVKELEK